jgi:hypothetical protein
LLALDLCLAIVAFSAVAALLVRPTALHPVLLPGLTAAGCWLLSRALAHFHRRG